MPHAIEAEQLEREYKGGLRAVDGIDLAVQPGEVYGFLGPNGAGKTTTLRMLLGLLNPDAGTATFDGTPYPALPDPVRTVGAVLETAFHPARSGRNHLRVLAAQAGIPRRRVEEVLELVAMNEPAKRRVGGYSMGMRQRLGLAAALLGEPQLLVLDEPANGLDPAGIRWLRDLLQALASKGRTILVSSHVLAEVEQIADEVVIIHRGRFIESGPTAELAARASGGVRVRSPAAARLRDALAAEGISCAVAGDGALLVTDARAERVGELAAAQGIVLHELVTERATLEETFLELTADSPGP